MIGRRGFLASLAGGFSALAIQPSDAHPYDDRWMRWSGWRRPANQDVEVGWWATPIDGRGLCFVSTTGGVVQEIHEGDVISLSHQKDWPLVTSWTSDRKKDAQKERARRALVTHLVNASGGR